MIPRIFSTVFHLGSVVLMALVFLPAAHAQQTDNVSGGAWQPHRPDNQPKQKEAISGGAVSSINPLRPLWLLTYRIEALVTLQITIRNLLIDVLTH